MQLGVIEDELLEPERAERAAVEFLRDVKELFGV
jgi:hypothetical protein